MVERGARRRRRSTSLPIAPLMHGAAQWGVMGGSFDGNTIVLVAKFDAGTTCGSSSSRTNAST